MLTTLRTVGGGCHGAEKSLRRRKFCSSAEEHMMKQPRPREQKVGAAMMVAVSSRAGLQQVHGVGGNHQLLVGGDDHDLNLRVVGRDDSLFAANVVLLLVELHAQELQTFANG